MTYRLKLTGMQLLHLWLALLNAWVERTGNLSTEAIPLPAAARAGFFRRNRHIQEELGRFFLSTRHICGQCGGTCCRRIGPLVPFQAVDFQLYDFFPHRRQHLETAEVQFLLRQFLWLNPLYLLLKLCGNLRPGHDRGKEEIFTASPAPVPFFAQPCVMLGESGCTLPWGARPGICVLFLCPDLLQEMALASYLQYFWLMVRYLGHLTLSVQARLAGLRKAA